jgi:hypothetical protein
LVSMTSEVYYLWVVHIHTKGCSFQLMPGNLVAEDSPGSHELLISNLLNMADSFLPPFVKIHISYVRLYSPKNRSPLSPRDDSDKHRVKNERL